MVLVKTGTSSQPYNDIAFDCWPIKLRRGVPREEACKTHGWSVCEFSEGLTARDGVQDGKQRIRNKCREQNTDNKKIYILLLCVSCLLLLSFLLPDVLFYRSMPLSRGIIWHRWRLTSSFHVCEWLRYYCRIVYIPGKIFICDPVRPLRRKSSHG